MKQKVLVIFTVLSLFGRSIPANPADSQTDTVRKLLVTIEEKAGNLQQGIPAEAVLLSIKMLRTIPEFSMLEKSAESLWAESMRNLAQVAPSDFAKTAFFRACQNMSPENYVGFLNAAAFEYDRQVVSKQLLKVAIYPDGKLRHILTDNYRDKGVIEFCEHAKRIWADEPQMIAMFNSILSGKTKRGIDQMRRAGALNVPEIKIIPSSLTQNMDTSANVASGDQFDERVTTKPQATPAEASPSNKASYNFSLGWIIAMLSLLFIVGSFAWRKRH